MRQLVQECLCPIEALVIGRRIAEEVGLVVRDAGHVFHGAGVVLGHEHLVVLGAERVRPVK